MSEQATANNEKKQDKRLIIAIIIILLLLALLIATWIFFLRQNGSKFAWDPNATEADFSEEVSSGNYDGEKVAEGMLCISMNTNPVFEDGASDGTLGIVNDISNNYPLVVYIVRSDTHEEIYRSGAIPVGSEIKEAPLDVALAEGDYDCVAYFNSVNVDTGTFLGTAGAEITITVEN
jgi:hypothetical protein